MRNAQACARRRKSSMSQMLRRRVCEDEMESAVNDYQLLQKFAQSRDQSAFAELTARHADMVYSAAMRQVRNAHLAEDVTQGVFLALSQRANSIGKDVLIAGWLYRATIYAAKNALKSEARRQRREAEAAK